MPPARGTAIDGLRTRAVSRRLSAMHRIPAASPLRARLRPLAPLGAVVVAALVVRGALTPLYAYLPNGYLDEGFWKYWMEHIRDGGVLNIYRNAYTDYVGYQWVLWLMSIVYGWIGGPYTATTPSLHVFVKTPSIAFDVALIVVVYAATLALARERTPEPGEREVRRLALIAAGVIAFQPAVLYDGAVWAQLESAVTASMLAAVLLAARGRPATGWATLAAGMMVKPQPVVVVPVLVVLTVHHGGWRALPRSMVAAGAVVAVVLAPWVVHGDAGRIAHTYRALFDADYERLAAGAWNIWWPLDVARHPHPEDTIIGPLTFRAAGLILSAAAAVLALAYVALAPRLRTALIAAAYLAFAFYMLPISTHERYGYPFLALLLPVLVLDRRWLWLYVPVSLTMFANLFLAAPPMAGWADRWLESPFSIGAAVINTILFVGFTAYLSATVARAMSDGVRRFSRLRGARQEAAAVSSAS